MLKLFTIHYGSHLYGTSTPTSDVDLKTIYLPSMDDVLLGRDFTNFKIRSDAEGNPVRDDMKMPANGVEEEYIAFQTLVRDFTLGQTYAVECVFALLRMWQELLHIPKSIHAMQALRVLSEVHVTADVNAMVGFAKKQTFDYVHRGRRLLAAKNVLAAVQNLKLEVEQALPNLTAIRLDTVHGEKTVLHHLAERTTIKLGTSTNNNRTMETLELGGRSYLETSELGHVQRLLEKQVASYGERSTDAGEKQVDLKSLVHAVRVYQQAMELLTTGTLVFPRPNAPELLAMKKGEVPLDTIRGVLEQLEVDVEEAKKTSTLQPRTPETELAAENFLLGWLRVMYGLERLN